MINKNYEDDTYIINIGIDNTFIYKINKIDNRLDNFYDNTGNFKIPTVIYLDENLENILYGNETMYKMFKNNYISHFLLDTQKYDVKKLLLYYIQYLIKIIENQNEKNIINYIIVIPYYIVLQEEETNLKEVYEYVKKKLNRENISILLEELNTENDIFIAINDNNTIIKSKNNIEIYDGLGFFKNELFKVIKNKLKIIKNNDEIKIKQFIQLNFIDIIQTIKLKTYNCILELTDDIYKINITKYDLYNSIKLWENNIFKYKNNENFLLYDLNFEYLLSVIYENDISKEYAFKRYNNEYINKKILSEEFCEKNKDNNNLYKEKDIILQTSLGMKLENDMMCRFINRNTKIPYTKTKLFKYKIENKENKEITLSIYKGNNLYIEKNTLLKNIYLPHKSGMNGSLNLKITFSIEKLNYLNVTIENIFTKEKYDINDIYVDIKHENSDNEESDNESDTEFQSIKFI